MADPTVVEVAQAVLTAAAGALTDPPARQVVTHAQPVADCDLVATWIAAIRPTGGRRFTEPGRPAQRATGLLTVVDVGLLVLRCVTTRPDPLDAATVTAEASTAAADAAALWAALTAAARGNTLVPGLPTGAATSFAELTPIAAEGGIAGWRTTVTIELRTVAA